MTDVISNPLIDKLPPHLKQFIKPQDYERYTPIDQAVWRYVMRKNVASLPEVAHTSYLDGLARTGISLEEIPSMYGMNRILKDIGWAAVAVDGFIPPNAFMEFQAYNILVIASDIRQLQHIEYTPAPDIIHEAAGHAPIIANPDYAQYLKRFGKIGCKAISSKKDYEMYEAVRKLSILKEAKDIPDKIISAAEEKVAILQNTKETPSEMAKIRNLHWWTVEYGLIGTVENPKIYGAGLLSSIGESEWCMTDQVQKKKYSAQAALQDFDITQPQPQLFVTPDFAYLCQELEEFADTMALRKGGHRGVTKLIASQNLGTIELNTGLQISGVFSKVLTDDEDQVIYFETQKETALSYREKELIEHGTKTYPDGFVSPIGKLKGSNLRIEAMSPRDLKAYNFYEGKFLELEYESGIRLAGTVVTGTRNVMGSLILIHFSDCEVSFHGEQLFKTNSGTFNLAIGSEIISAYSGPADDYSFDLITHVSETSTVRTYAPEEKELHQLYQAVRNIRNGENTKYSLNATFNLLQQHHPKDWLLCVEIYELVYQHDEGLEKEILNHLNQIKKQHPSFASLIDSGMQIITSKEAMAF